MICMPVQCEITRMTFKNLESWTTYRCFFLGRLSLAQEHSWPKHSPNYLYGFLWHLFTIPGSARGPIIPP